MSKSRLSWKIILAAGAIAMFSLAAYNYVCRYCGGPVQLTLSGGNVCPLRSEMAKRITAEVAADGIELARSSDTNSESICADVNSRKIDLGLVLGGFPPAKYKNVRQVAVLGVEPLQLVVRGELASRVHTPSIELVRGQRVSLGEQGSNGALLAADLMRFARMRAATATDPGDYQAVYTREADVVEQLRTWDRAAPPVRAVLAERLPDAFFIVDSLPSTLVDELVRTAGYRLVPLPFATAMHLNGRRDEAHQDYSLESTRLEPFTIPAYTYGIDPAVPPQDCPTFGLRLLLVANRKVPANSVLRLLRSLDHGVAERYHIDLDAGSKNVEFPLHPGAKAFAEGRKPLSFSQLLEPLTNVLSVAGAGAAGGLAIWGFLRGLRAVHPDVHLRQIDRIERVLKGYEHDDLAPTLPLEFIDYLEARLADIKRTAIDDYSRGRLESDEALVGILTLTADTRHLLAQRRFQLCQDTSPPVSVPARASRFLDAA